MYMALKHLHLTAVSFSFVVFLIAFAAAILQSPLAEKKWLKILPHVLYTVILITAISLWLSVNAYAFDWLASKLLGFILYVLSISYAIKWAKNNRMRYIGLASAFAWLLLTASIAFSKNALF
ncbi:MAG: SirB2 family protein [Pseudomonadota bacterium]